MLNNNKSTKLLLVFLGSLFSALVVFGQKKDTIKQAINFKSNIAITNNGFSFIPSFSLGKPATIINLSVGGKKIFFEPELRFSLEGKPWSFIFIWRYKVIDKKLFQLTAGVHLPALNFRTVSVEKNGIVQDIIQNQRFVSTEITPQVNVTKNTNISMLYLYGRGIENDATKNTHFIALRCSMVNSTWFKNYTIRFNPQVFYLNMDRVDGYYAAGGCTISRQHFPLSVSTMMFAPISSNIAGKNFDWNVSINYSINKKFIAK